MAQLLVLAIPTHVGFSKPQSAQPSGHFLWLVRKFRYSISSSARTMTEWNCESQGLRGLEIDQKLGLRLTAPPDARGNERGREPKPTPRGLNGHNGLSDRRVGNSIGNRILPNDSDNLVKGF
jgi:hypothetical protein